MATKERKQPSVNLVKTNVEPREKILSTPTIIPTKRAIPKEQSFHHTSSPASSNSDFYIDFGPFISPFYQPKNIGIFAIPYTNGMGHLSNLGTLDSNCKIKELFQARQLLESIFKDRLDLQKELNTNGSTTNPLHLNKIPYEKYLSIHVDYLKKLVEIKDRPESHNLLFTWSPLIVGIHGEECLIRYNLTILLLNVVQTKQRELIPIHTLEKYSKFIQKCIQSVNHHDNQLQSSVWRQLSIKKGEFKNMRQLYSNALYEIEIIQETFLDVKQLKNEPILREVRRILNEKDQFSRFDEQDYETVQKMDQNSPFIVKANMYGIFAMVNHNDHGLNISNLNINNIMIADIITPDIIHWLKEFVGLNLQLVIYYQAISEYDTEHSVPTSFHKFLFTVANLALGKLSLVRNSLILINDKFKNATIDEHLKEQFINFIDIKDQMNDLNKIEVNLLNLLYFHAIQHYWVNRDYSASVFLALQLKQKLKRSKRVLNLTHTESNNGDNDSDDDNDNTLHHGRSLLNTPEDEIVLASKPVIDFSALRIKLSNVFENNQSSNVNIGDPMIESKTDKFNSLSRGISFMVYSHLIAHILEENKIWQTGVTLKSTIEMNPFYSLSKMHAHTNCIGVGNDITLDQKIVLQKQSKNANDGTDLTLGMDGNSKEEDEDGYEHLLGQIILTKNRIEKMTVFPKIQSNPNEAYWWNHVEKELDKALLVKKTNYSDFLKANQKLENILSFYQDCTLAYNSI